MMYLHQKRVVQVNSEEVILKKIEHSCTITYSLHLELMWWRKNYKNQNWHVTQMHKLQFNEHKEL